MNVFLINTKELPCPGSHYLHTKKFLSGFCHYGYNFIEINDIKDIEKYEDMFTDIIYISNHGYKFGLPKEIDILCERKNSTFIFWYGHDYIDLLSKKINKWILTGEHFRKKPQMSSHLKSFDIQNSINNYIPLTFASNLHPNDIILKENFDEYLYDCNFVGFCYNTQWSYHLKKKLNCYIKYSPPFISEKERIDSFKNSLSSLGFQHPNNKLNYVITERIFEALSFSCLLFVDSIFIEEEIPNGVVYVSSPDEIVSKLNYFKSNMEELKYIVSNGLDYVKKNGTYFNVCGNFLKKINEIYHPPIKKMI